MNKSILLLAFFIILKIQLFAQLNVTVAGALNYPRWSHESQRLLDGRVISFGGDNGDLSNNLVYNNCEIYDPSTNSWSVGSNMNNYRTDFASAILNDGRVLAIGGRDENFNNLNSCEIYNPTTNTWSIISSLNESRAFHKAIRLSSGQILVVGGNSGTNTAEIYDPYSNTWTYTDTLAKRHKTGISFVSPGYVSGGIGASNRVETFNETTNSWNLLSGGFITPRINHSSIFIPSWGALFAFTGESTHKNTEAIQINNGVSYNRGNLLTEINNNTPIAFDNGHVLVYGVGDLFSPTNTKCLQLYSLTNFTWTSGTYNFVGADVYGINKLHNGKILINGGSFTTGNGATNECKLIGLNSYSACVPPNLNLSLTGISSCYGNSHTITIQGSESGVTYEARIAENVVSLASINGNGTNRDIILSPTSFQPGDNIVSIVAKKTGCPAYYLDNNVIITPTLAITETPTISPSGTIYACIGDNITLTTTNGYSNYIWSFPQVTTSSNTISVNPNKTVYVKFKDANGCTSVSSKMVKINAPTSLTAGSNISLCSNQGTVQLTGVNTPGGIWSGTGVTPSGVFDPASVTSGTYNVTYSKCGFNATKTVSVFPVTVPSYTAVSTTTAICAYQSATLQIPNSSFGVKYQLRNGNLLINTAKNGTGGLLTFTTNVISANSVFNILATTTSTNCNADTVITEHFIKVKNSTLTKVSGFDTLICIGKKALIVVDSAVAGVTYSLTALNTTGSTFLQNKVGDGDSIAFSVGPITTNSVFSIVMWQSGCSNLAGLDQSIRPKINVQTPQAFFAPSKFNIQPNEYISFNNNSPVPNSTYLWSFDNGSSTSTSNLVLPDSIYYSTLGSKKIKLKLRTPLGCIDSLVQTVNVFPLSTATSCPISFGRVDNISAIITSLTNDKKDNIYAFSDNDNSTNNSIYSINNDSIKTIIPYNNKMIYSNSLMKYDKYGIPLWLINIRHNSTLIRHGNIECDSLGNIYLTYYHGGYIGNIYFYSVDNTVTEYFPPYNSNERSVIICKYNSNGYFQWVKSYLEDVDNPVLKIDNKRGFIYACSDRHFNKYDINGNLLWAISNVYPLNNGYVAIETDTSSYSYILNKGNINVVKYNSSGAIVSSTQPQVNINQSYVEASHLKIEKNNAYLSGTFKGTIKYVNDTFVVLKNSTGNPDGFIASCNLSNGNHRWFIQLKLKYGHITITGMDFKNGKGIITGSLWPNSLDTLFANNHTLPINTYSQFVLNFDSLGNVIDLMNINNNNASNNVIPKYLCVLNNTNTDATILTEFKPNFSYNSNSYSSYTGSKHFAILNYNSYCIQPLVTNVTTKIDATSSVSDVFIYPNPQEYNQELKLSIASNSNTVCNITAFDVSGKKLFNLDDVKISGGENIITIDEKYTNTLNSGIYFLNISSTIFNKTVKLIVN